MDFRRAIYLMTRRGEEQTYGEWEKEFEEVTGKTSADLGKPRVQSGVRKLSFAESSRRESG